MAAAVIRRDRHVLMLGLSRQTVARLQAGQSIWITESTHGKAVPKGLVGPETEVTVAPQLGI